MAHEHLHRSVPLERFRRIVAALREQGSSWTETYWMRFAAQAAVLCPEPPERTAEAIRDVARALLEHGPWYSALAAPQRFVVAAAVVQIHEGAQRFLAEHDRLRSALRERGIRRGGPYETFAILILFARRVGSAVPDADLDRLAAVHQAMRRHHWWLTGADDLPACAALAGRPGEPTAIEAAAEDAYAALRAEGLARGQHLQTAANLLPLGDDVETALARFRALHAAIAADEGLPAGEMLEALAVLALLDHEPQTVLGTFAAVRRELALADPIGEGASGVGIAAELAALDLVRFDGALQPLREPERAAAMLRSIDALRAAGLVLASQARPVVEAPLDIRTTWPAPF